METAIATTSLLLVNVIFGTFVAYIVKRLVTDAALRAWAREGIEDAFQCALVASPIAAALGAILGKGLAIF